ncbi:MAG: hypothetical protein PHO37_01390 [Kiritimatiellae bacterium]|nr:hypothetical protein [Kiritimatiellia bacterium]
MGVHRIAADILKTTQYIRRYAVDGCEVYPPLCGGWLRSISAAMRWMAAKYIRRYAVDYCQASDHIQNQHAAQFT